MYEFKSGQKSKDSSITDLQLQVTNLMDQKVEIDKLLEDYEEQIDSYQNKVSEKDLQIDVLRDQLERYKQEKEDSDIIMEKKMQAKEQEHEIYVKNLKSEIDQLA